MFSKTDIQAITICVNSVPRPISWPIRIRSTTYQMGRANEWNEGEFGIWYRIRCAFHSLLAVPQLICTAALIVTLYVDAIKLYMEETYLIISLLFRIVRCRSCPPIFPPTPSKSMFISLQRCDSPDRFVTSRFPSTHKLARDTRLNATDIIMICAINERTQDEPETVGEAI